MYHAVPGPSHRRTSEPPQQRGLRRPDAAARRLTPWAQDPKFAVTPQAADLYGPTPLMGLLGPGPPLTPSQALAITLARHKAAVPPTFQEEQPFFITQGMAVDTDRVLNPENEDSDDDALSYLEELAVSVDGRLAALNADWGTAYTKADLAAAAACLASAPITINVALSGRDIPLIGDTLGQQLRDSPGLMNQWQSGTSGGSTNLMHRAEVEMSFGYGLPLSHLPADPGRAHEMPIYGALNVTRSPCGAAPHYGPSHLVLKEAARARATVTPNDSFITTLSENPWSLACFPTTRYRFPADDPGGLLITRATPNRLLRYAFAAGTGQDAAWLRSGEATQDAANSPYIEVQIHGGVTWNDIAEVVIGPDEDDAPRILREFQQFADSHQGLAVSVASRPRAA